MRQRVSHRPRVVVKQTDAARRAVTATLDDMKRQRLNVDLMRLDREADDDVWSPRHRRAVFLSDVVAVMSPRPGRVTKWCRRPPPSETHRHHAHARVSPDTRILTVVFGVRRQTGNRGRVVRNGSEGFVGIVGLASGEVSLPHWGGSGNDTDAGRVISTGRDGKPPCMPNLAVTWSGTALRASLGNGLGSLADPRVLIRPS